MNGMKPPALRAGELSPPERATWQVRREAHRAITERRLEEARTSIEANEKALTEARAGRLPLAVVANPDSSYQYVVFLSTSGSVKSWMAYRKKDGVQPEETLLQKLSEKVGSLGMKEEEAAEWRRTFEEMVPEQLAGILRGSSGPPVRFGARMAPSSKGGVEVATVSAGSPAAALSLSKGDRIMRIETTPVSTPAVFFSVLGQYEHGSRVRLWVKPPLGEKEALKWLTIERLEGPKLGSAVLSEAARSLELERKSFGQLEDGWKQCSAMTLEKFADDFVPRLKWSEAYALGDISRDEKQDRSTVRRREVVATVPYLGVAKEVVMLPTRQGSLEAIRSQLGDWENAMVSNHQASRSYISEQVNLLKEFRIFLESMSDQEFETAYRSVLEEGSRKNPQPPLSSLPTSSWLGLSVETSDPKKSGEAERGIRIKSVVEKGPAHRAGLRPGDRLVGWEDVPLSDFPSLMAVLNQYAPGSRVKLKIVRKGATEIEKVSVTLEAQPK